MSLRSDTPTAGDSAAETAVTGPNGLLVLVALIALALILRSPLTAIAPIINDLRQGLAIGPVMAGLLTSIPVLCFGVLTPLASLVIARTGIEASIFLMLGCAALGMILRPAGGIELALAGTLVLGAALTVGNIVCLMVIARDFPRRVRQVTGIYASAINVGTMLTSALTAPLAVAFGWRMALASTVTLVVPAIMLWVLVGRHRGGSTDRTGIPEGKDREGSSQAKRPPQAAPSTAETRPVWRRGLVWLLVIAFGAHLSVYFGLTAWLPAYLMQDCDMDATAAGLAASLFQILALLGSFGVPLIAGRISAPWLLVGVAACWVATPLGFLAAPHAWLVWATVGGIASGGGFTVIFTFIMTCARDLDENRKISALVQGCGYTVSSTAPLIIGSLHQASGGWASSFLMLAGIATTMVLAGINVARMTTR